MRLLDPFAGYSKANGIHVFHLALFMGSYSVNVFEKLDEGEASAGEEHDLEKTFIRLRWSHLMVACLAVISIVCRRESNVPEIKKALAEDATEDEKKEAKISEMKSMNRDGHWRIIANIADILSIFQYSLNVFTAQLAVTQVTHYCLLDGGDWSSSIKTPDNQPLTQAFID